MSGVPGPGLQLPPPAGPVDDATVTLAIELLDRAGVAATAEAALAKPTGRPRSVPVQAVLVALLLLATDDRPLLLTNVTDLLYRRLSETSQQRLGISGRAPDGKPFLARYRCVRYCFAALCSTMDPSPLPKNRRLPDEQLAAATTPMPPAQAEAARGRLETFANTLLEASISVLTDDERSAWDGSVGLDATCVPLYSRGPSKRAGLCASDPDGGWYVREGDHRDPEDHTGRRRTRIAWALEATIATMAPDTPGAAPTHPNLAIGLAFDRPGVDPGGTGARVLASVRGRGHPAGFLGADRAYTAALPERFHLPVTALGYTPVMDYRADQLGIQANTGGALLVEGAWCCPAIPDPLVTATADHRDQRIDTPLHTTRIDARGDYRLRRKDGPDADGYQRYSCPALGDHPRLSCPLRDSPPTTSDGRTPVLQPPADPPKICTQTAITIAPDIGARHRQHLPYGTETWARRYATLRNTIEGLNGYAKDPAHEALGLPGRRRVRGLAAQTILCATLLMAANLRKIRAHRAMLSANRADHLARRARRRRTSLRDYQPDG
jgi:hypothetical protein